MRQLHATVTQFLGTALGRYLSAYSESLDNPPVVNQATWAVMPVGRVVTTGGAFHAHVGAKLVARLPGTIPYPDLPFGDFLGLWGSVAALWIGERGQTLDDGPAPVTVTRGSDISDDWLITLQWVFCTVQTPVIEPPTVTPDPDVIVVSGASGRIQIGLWRSPADTIDNLVDDFRDQVIR